MKLLFLTLIEINSLEERGIYQDLLRKFISEGDEVTIVTPVERRKKVSTQIIRKERYNILQVKTFNIQKTNVLEKGLGTLAIEYQYLKAVKKYLKNQTFDLVLYSTPPITFGRVISYVKKRDKAYSYLLLKDIFPQNAIDMKMMKKNGLLHRYFLKKEKHLYKISDTIGCMSEANLSFLLSNNPEVSTNKIEINPNSIEPVELKLNQEEKDRIKDQYNIPKDKKIFIYGGNLGRPQGVDFLIETIHSTDTKEVFFLIVGNGTEFKRLDKWFKNTNPENALLLRHLPKLDYDKVLASCDVGMIFLDKNFLIPNFPSRLLSYLENKMPIIAATDPNTDIGDIIEESGCGYKVLAGDIRQMQETIRKMVMGNMHDMGQKSWKLLQEKYLVDYSYALIKEKVKYNV